jgi:hypothetical protein
MLELAGDRQPAMTPPKQDTLVAGLE